MDEEYEFQEFADMAIAEITEFVNVEQQFIEQEHKLIESISGFEYVLMHLDERIPSDMKEIHTLHTDITNKLIEIRDLVESDRLKDLRLEKEEEAILQRLREDVAHRDWRAVKSDLKAEKEEEEKVLRLEIVELRELHSKFMDLMKLIKRGNISAADEEIQHYFMQISTFANAYERIFRQLWKKENILYGKIKKTSKKIK